MRKIIRTAAAALVAASLASCAIAPNGAGTSSASAVTSARAWLEEKLGGETPSELIVDVSDGEGRYGVDMSDFEDDGYYIRAEGGEVVILGATDAALDRAVRKYAKCGNPDDYEFAYHEGYRVKRLTVCGEDISAFAIIVDDDADEAMRYAASELSKYVEKACGAKLAVFTATKYAAIENAPKPIRLTVDYPALGDEAFKILVSEDGPSIEISGGRYRGCMYGVYGLLEDMGWRFLCSPNDYEASAEIDYLYESEHVDLTSALDREESPAIGYRLIHGLPHNSPTIREKYRAAGGRIGAYGYTGIACHGLDSYKWLDEEKLHPNPYTQPCFSDPDVIECVCENAVAEVARRLEAGQQIGREIVTIDVAQYDTTSFCSCKRCKDIEKVEGGRTGPVIRFTNAVADALNEEYPGVSVSMLAYAGTNAPPWVTKPRDNVRISYAIYIGAKDTTCSAHNVSGENCDTGRYNNYYWKELEGWAAICSNRNLDLWYYPFNCGGVAAYSPMTDVHYENLKILTSGQINGIHLDDDNWSQGITLDPLLSYVGSKMLWNPDITKDEYDALVAEWFDIIYGEAGDLVYTHMRQMEIAGHRTGCWCAFDSEVYEKLDYGYLAEHFDEWWDMYLLARDAAESARELEYVERYFAGVLFMGVGITHEARYLNGSEAERAEFAERYTEMYRLFRKYRLMVFNNYSFQTYAPDELVLDDNPFDTWTPTPEQAHHSYTYRIGGKR